jgi:hypothetical protein
MASTVVLGIASMLGAAGCSMDQSGVDPQRPVVAQLADPSPLPFDMDSSRIVVDGRELPMLTGQVKLGAYYYKGNVVELDGVDVGFDTMHVTGQSPGIEGYELRHARVSLAHPVVAPVEWTELGDAGFAELDAELLLDWSVVGPTGIEVQLATQHIKHVVIELDLYTGVDGTLNAVLTGAKPGTFWTWAGVAKMSDLAFDLRAQRLPVLQ